MNEHKEVKRISLTNSELVINLITGTKYLRDPSYALIKIEDD